MNQTKKFCQVKLDKNKVLFYENPVKYNFTNMSDTFGHWLKTKREAAGLNQTELARKSRVSKQTISLLERDEIEQPRKYQIAKIAKALNEDVKSVQQLAAGFDSLRDKIPDEIMEVGFEGLNKSDLREVAAFIKFKREQRHMTDNPDIEPLDDETLRSGGHLSRKPILLEDQEEEAQKKKTPFD